MKKIILFVLVICLNISFAKRGAGQGNGGDLVICNNEGSFSYELLDYYEGKYKLKIELDMPAGLSYLEVSKGLLERIPNSGLRDAALSLLVSFEDSLVPAGELPNVEDEGVRVELPKNCQLEQLVIQYNSLEKEDIRYHINTRLWDALSEHQKAGVVVHEIIYALGLWLGHLDSVYIRDINYSLAINELVITPFGFPQLYKMLSPISLENKCLELGLYYAIEWLNSLCSEN